MRARPAATPIGRPPRIGISISGYASTPYNVAVGGTDFEDTYSE